MRLRHKPGIIEKLAILNKLVLPNPQQYRGKWSTLFGNDKPLHLELGTGKGGFLNALSLLNPKLNFIGIERVPDILYLAATKITQEQQTNVRLIMFDAAKLLEIFQPGEIGRIYLNFSDPWPKTRHARRRMTHSDFLRIYQRILQPGGEIHIKTDNRELFEYSLRSLVLEGFSLRRITYDLHQSCSPFNVMTEYEQRFSDLGQPIYRLEALTPFRA